MSENVHGQLPERSNEKSQDSLCEWHFRQCLFRQDMHFTVHACYGLGTADLPSKLVVERAVSNNLVAERIKKSFHCNLGQSEHVELKSV